jgi:hypothetical protein
MRSPIKPVPPRKSQYGIAPDLVAMRGSDLPDMTSVLLSKLIPDLPQVIYPSPEGIATVRRATAEALAQVDMSMIKPGDSVNILASHHGFLLVGGEAYAEMLRTIRDVVHQRTGTNNIRLRAGVGLRFRETEEYIKRFELDKHFNGKAEGVAPIDRGIPIETEIGTLYGIARVYDAKWIIHAHNSDVREVHFHRQVDRAVKPFGMSYARIETRSTYHQNLGPRAANFVARAIFESPLVQSKFAFTCFQVMAPNGVVRIDADNDLYALNDRITRDGCRYYGKVMTLLGEIDECITILDFPAPVPYNFAAGVIYANFCGANVDLYDLDNPLPPYTWYTEAYYGKDGKPLIEGIPPVNPAIKMCIHNYAWTGYPSVFFAEQVPTLVVGEEQAQLMRDDPQNIYYMDHALVAPSLKEATRFARRAAGTDNILIFDGAAGGINVSPSLAEVLKEKAPWASKRVEKELFPRWLRQRGLEVAEMALS